MKALKIFIATLVAAIGIGTAAGTANAINPEQTSFAGVTQKLNGDLNYFWWKSIGSSYRTPGMTYYNSAQIPFETHGCGIWTDYNNSFYCPSNFRLFMDLDFNNALVGRGDFQAGFLLAHEWSHHAQNILGWSTWADRRNYDAGAELQADCYAGIYARDAWNRRLLNDSDVFEARAWLTEFGDGPGSSLYAEGAHGEGWLRVPGSTTASTSRASPPATPSTAASTAPVEPRLPPRRPSP